MKNIRTHHRVGVVSAVEVAEFANSIGTTSLNRVTWLGSFLLRLLEVIAPIMVPLLIAIPFVTHKSPMSPRLPQGRDGRHPAALSELELAEMETWMMPSAVELQSRYESLEAARHDVLRLAHRGSEDEMMAAADRYRLVASAWRNQFAEVRRRLTPQQSRDLRYVLSPGGCRTEVLANEIYQWESDGLELKSR